jgi:hypothetical protein
MNKIILILLTLLLLMLILNHAKDESKSELEKILFEELSGIEYGDGKPRLIQIPAPTGNARDYPGDLPSTAPPPGTPIWCPPPEEGYGPPPPYPEADECIY